MSCSGCCPSDWIQLDEKIRGSNFQESWIAILANRYVVSAVICLILALLLSNEWQSLLSRQVAQKFYSLLVLKKQQAIELYQNTDVEYDEIFIKPGPRYNEVLLSCGA